jgi:serine O-acetyltransferase
MFNRFKEELQAVYQKDPSAKNAWEIIFCYGGFQALWLYRLAHLLHGWKIPFLPRLISHLTRVFSGVEIHPAAQIGRRVFIDHGQGVVIGETSVIGDDVVIYQQVTLGGTGKTHGKRHPTIGNHVILGAGAKILGNITIGEEVRIGAGSVVVTDVPPRCTVVGVPGRVVRQQTVTPEGELQHNIIPDPVKAELERLSKETARLAKEVEHLKNSSR